MLNFYQALGMVVMTCFGFGALLAQRLTGELSIGIYDLTMFFAFTALSIYLTINSYKAKGTADVE
jgi:hypothetical protein